MNKNSKIHPCSIPNVIVEKVLKRRGRLHAFEKFVPSRTALVVVDLDSRALEEPHNSRIRDIASKVNTIADTLRLRGGTIAWVTTPIQKASPNFIAIYGKDFAKMHENASVHNGTATKVWDGLHTNDKDVFVEKKGANAFFPGNCDLHHKLKELDILSILIVGMVTNVCCDSTARGATELDYQVTMISDAMWGHKEGQHEATLATFFRNFGDVRPTSEVLKLMDYKD